MVIEIVPSGRIDYCSTCKADHGYDCPMDECEHGSVRKYCFNCRFKEKYGMKIEMFEGHHYVRLKDVEKFLKSLKK